MSNFKTVLIGLLALLLAAPAAAQDLSGEHITLFDVELDLQSDGDLHVVETITIQDYQGQSRRGIFRELPAKKRNSDYDIVEPVNYRLISITRDGQNETVSESYPGNAIQWRIGSASIYLPNGQHTYRIEYEVENEIRYREDFDELLWNVTGNYWNYPVAKAQVRVRVPQGAEVIDYNANTGRIGEGGQNFIASRDNDEIRFVTQKPLRASEGLTVSISVPKGAIAGLSAAEKQRYWWMRNGALIVMSLISLGVFAFYYLQWSRVGKDPAKQPVFARYEPPLDPKGKPYSAAAAQKVLHKGLHGDSALIATLIGLSVKGWIDLQVDKKTTTLTRTDPNARKDELLTEEALLFDKLFSKRRDELHLDGSPNTEFHTADTFFRSHLRQNYARDYHRRNAGFIVMGVLFSLVGGAAALAMLNGYVSPLLPMLGFGLLAMNILFIVLMPAPTKLGQSARAGVDGFKLYLETAEKGRFNAVEVGSGQEPPMTQERYESFLPYAVALDVEKPWTKHFETSLPEIARDYRPSYATGTRAGSMGRGGIGGMTRGITKSLATGVQKAAPIPTSTSGSSGGFSSGGGGGFSGGGGGGGGGGSW